MIKILSPVERASNLASTTRFFSNPSINLNFLKKSWEILKKLRLGLPELLIFYAYSLVIFYAKKTRKYEQLHQDVYVESNRLSNLIFEVRLTQECFLFKLDFFDFFQ